MRRRLRLQKLLDSQDFYKQKMSLDIGAEKYEKEYERNLYVNLDIRKEQIRCIQQMKNL